MKYAYVKTYGCDSNLYDSNRIKDLLEHHGYRISEDGYSEANLLIMNTCNIREKAAEKMYSELGRWKTHKDERKAAGDEAIIVVAGCVGQAEGGLIRQRAPHVDVVLGSQVYHKLPEILERLKREKSTKGDKSYRVNTQFPVEPKFDFLPEVKVRQVGSACLAIQEGCDKFCTFCCVPYTRGPEYSRPVADLVYEAKLLVDQGIKEILLQGQNVSAYRGGAPSGKGTYTLAQLCLELASLSGVERLRYTSSHPRDMTQELANLHRDCDKVMPSLHLPVQSGSNAVLKRMNRRHTREEYLDIWSMFQEAKPSIKFTSDFIVGFPGETERDFEDTLDLVHRVQFTRSYSFAYSQRPGTPAAIDALQVSEDVKKARLLKLQGVLDDYEALFNKEMVGMELPVLFNRHGRREGQLVGHSLYMQSVYATAPVEMLGNIVPVRVIRAGGHGLGGEIVG